MALADKSKAMGSFLDSVARGSAAVATGGASEVLVSQQAKSGDKRGMAQSIFDAATGKSATATQRGGTIGSSSINIDSYSNYIMNGDFLLDTRQGRVWKYDDSQKAFVRINRESTTIEKAVMSSSLNTVKTDLKSAFNALSEAEQGEVKEVYEMNDKALTQHIMSLSR